jgi:hypothetical protein
MVLLNAAKAARNAASLVNRPTCGGNKKAGTGPKVGWFLPSQPFLLRVPQSVPLFCVPSTTIQTQKYGYRATISHGMG